MNFDLTKPCSDCPFRSDIRFHLAPGRTEDIIDSITRGQGTFSCHKTTVGGECEERQNNKDTQHCAGALIFLEKLDLPNQMMRIMERLGMYDRRKLDMEAPVYESAEEMIEVMDG